MHGGGLVVNQHQTSSCQPTLLVGNPQERRELIISSEDLFNEAPEDLST